VGWLNAVFQVKLDLRIPFPFSFSIYFGLEITFGGKVAWVFFWGGAYILPVTQPTV